MTDESKKLLFDVQEAAASVLRYTEGGSLSEFAASRMMRRAVEREFEIMGEALNRLRRSDPAVAARIPDLQKVIGFRNRVIHGYDSIDDAITWGVVQRRLPDLLAEVSRLLEANDSSDEN
ncbi:DUF86 domain-containing protein [soil metagenome]